LIRVGEVSVAAGVAGLTAVISVCTWMHGSEPADAAARAGSGLSVFGTIHPPLLSYGAQAPQADLPNPPGVRLASLDSTFESRFAPDAAGEDQSDAPKPKVATSSFEERFYFDGSAPLSALRPSTSFEDRFGGVTGSARAAAPAVAATVATPAARAANVTPPRGPRLAAVPLPRPAPRSLVAQRASNHTGATYRVASLSDTPVPAAYAPAEEATKDPRDSDPAHTAIYDISAHTVYLPSGDRLEAHSGLGDYMDDIRAVHLRKRGPTPPNVYDLTLRESLFHGVQAIRLNPVAGSKMYGRDGMLVHPFMLGPQGDSNGCVSLKDYPAFLKAYMRGDITRLVVVERLEDPPGGRTATDWISGTLKKLFGRS